MSSGLPLKADIARCSRHVAFVPIPDSCKTIASLFDHLIGADHSEAEPFGRLHVDHYFEFSRLLNRQIGRFGAFENFINVAACMAEQIGYIGTV
jgi:hypothetical protein